MNYEKPLNPFKINPEHLMGFVKSFMKAYPHYFHDLKQIALQGERDCAKLDLSHDYASDPKDLKFKGNFVNYSNFTTFWNQYLHIEDLHYGDHLIKNYVFENIKPSNHNSIFKTAGKQNLSYSLVISKVGIKIEILIKTLRKDIKDKKKFNKLIFNEMLKNKTYLNKKIKNLVWDRLDNRVYSRIYFVIKKCSLNNKVDLPRLSIDDLYSSKHPSTVFSEMASATDKFYQVFDPIIKKLDIKLIEKKL